MVDSIKHRIERALGEIVCVLKPPPWKSGLVVTKQPEGEPKNRAALLGTWIP